MLNVTADTNILISATIARGNEYELLELARTGKIKITLSPLILNEFRNVISRPTFGYAKRQIYDHLKQIMTICYIKVPRVKVNAITDDPADNMVLECAEAADVDYIVSGDRHLLNLRQYKQIEVLRTADFLKIFRACPP